MLDLRRRRILKNNGEEDNEYLMNIGGEMGLR